MNARGMKGEQKENGIREGSRGDERGGDEGERGNEGK